MVWQTALGELFKKTDIYSRALEHNSYVNTVLKQVSGISSYVLGLIQNSYFYSYTSIRPCGYAETQRSRAEPCRKNTGGQLESPDEQAVSHCFGFF